MSPLSWCTVAAILSSLLVPAVRAFRSRVDKIEVVLKATADPVNDSRLPEARGALRRQEQIARWNGRVHFSFLPNTSSVVSWRHLSSSNLSGHLVGILGVLVLLSSLIRHQYRPDLQAQGARHRAVDLRALIREVEDDLRSSRTLKECPFNL